MNLVIAMELASGSCHCEPCRKQGVAITCRKFFVIAMERSDRSNPIASRSPHCVRDDNPELASGSCHCDGVKRQKQSPC
jgi:hypothetical protein